MSSLELLVSAAALNGISPEGATLIRNGSHAMWALPLGIVARIGNHGTGATATREVAVSEFLNANGIRVVRALKGLVQPTIVDSCPVSWWELLPDHRPATPAELGEVLGRLHRVPIDEELELPRFSPLAHVRERVSIARDVDSVDLVWILDKLDALERQYAEQASGIPENLIHGDAWQGNVVVPDDEDPIMLDLEACCVGPKYWDLIPMAVDYTDFSRMEGREYGQFVNAYGFDVTSIPLFRTLADIQEFRWASYVIGKAEHDPAAAREAEHRLACLKGEVSKPWTWRAF